MRRIRTRRWLAACLVGGLVVAAAWAGFGADDNVKRELVTSLLLTAVFLSGFLYFTDYVGSRVKDPVRASYGYLEVVIGADGRVSTSKAVVWLWTVIFATALLLMSAMTWFSDLSVDAVFGQDWDPYLLLLGGPFASAVAAKGITAGRVGTETGTKTPNGSLRPRPAKPLPLRRQTRPNSQMCSRLTRERRSLPDTQYIVFSCVAILYFVGAMISSLNDYALGARSLTLPEIPNALLGLTSLAALTYVGAKVVAKEGVGIIDMTPNPVGRSQPLTIVLANIPENVSKFPASVQFAPAGGGDAETRKAELAREGLASKVTVRQAPVTPGKYQVTVTTAAGNHAGSHARCRGATCAGRSGGRPDRQCPDRTSQ